jgi:MFS family permease
MVERVPLNKALLPIFLVIVVDILGMTIILPLLPFYAEHLGASPLEVGMLVSVYALFQLVGGPMLGRMSDHTGRKPLLLLSQAGTLVGFGILAWANSLWLVFLSRIIDGFTAGNISLAQAYIADVTKPEERTKSFAVIGIAFGVGFLIGPAISGFLAQFGYQYPIFAAMALSATSILTTWVLLPSRKPALERDASRRLSVLDWGVYVQFFRRPGLSPLLWQFFAFIFAFSTFMAGFALFAERRFLWEGKPFSAREVGYVYAYIGLLGIILQGGLIGRLVRWLGDWKLVRYSFFFATIGFFWLGWTYSVGMLHVVAAVIAFSTGALRPALTSLITQAANRNEQGSVLGLTQSLQSIASIVAPFFAGLLIEHGHLAGWACLAGGATAAGFLIRNAVPVDAKPAPEPVRVPE